MLTQIFLATSPAVSLFSFFFAASIKGVEITAVDLGLDFDQADLADALNAQNKSSNSHSALLRVSPEDFENIYKWFIA